MDEDLDRMSREDRVQFIRAGGDLNGRNQGRLRMVNNTILFTRPPSRSTRP